MSPRASHFFCIILLAILLLTSPVAATRNKKIYVKSGQSIQHAIDRADPGDKIIVKKGVYKEQLLITKDDINLIGEHGAILEPPATYIENACYRLAGNVTTIENVETEVGTHAGICIIGDVVLKPFVVEHRRVEDVKRYIKSPLVSGFTVRNFTGLNIAVVGAQNARISHNKLIDGQRYGLLTLGSKNTRASHNSISSTTDPILFIGLCMDDKSDVEVWHNNIAGYFTGLCVQTNGADVKGNHVENTCSAVFVDPGIVGAKVRWNTIGKSAVICGFLPFPASYGIFVGGAKDTEVRWNYVEEINDGGNDTKIAVGIAVYDFTSEPPPAPPVVATGNVVRENYLKNNELDIQVYSAGEGNVAKKNKCKTAEPAEACVA